VRVRDTERAYNDVRGCVGLPLVQILSRHLLTTSAALRFSATILAKSSTIKSNPPSTSMARPSLTKTRLALLPTSPLLVKAGTIPCLFNNSHVGYVLERVLSGKHKLCDRMPERRR
jgi:hypothetical protein